MIDRKDITRLAGHLVAEGWDREEAETWLAEFLEGVCEAVRRDFPKIRAEAQSRRYLN